MLFYDMPKFYHKFNMLRCSTALTVPVILAGALVAGPALANPQGGVVVGGDASIIHSGNKTDIHQHTDRAVIDWRSFDIGVGEHTQFYQPNSGSIVVNRVNSTNPSQILGTLSANGNVVLINPNGVMFGGGSRVDVSGLVATTADLNPAQFMNGGTLHFDKPGNPNASIIHNGIITAKEAGLVGLVAPHVVNNGIIEAKLGRVELASGDMMTVDMRGDGLIQVAVSDDVTSQMVSNTGKIRADGGVIAMTAAAGKNIVNSLIEIKGELKAPSVSQKNGKIIIGAAPSQPTKVVISGKLDVSGKKAGEKGGTVNVTARDVTLKSGSAINASGDAGGGTILVGGDYKGGGDMPAAQNVTMESGAVILNNAITQGDGGKTVLWSDDKTVFAGTIEGKGGADGGKGGFLETSGKKTLHASGNVDLRASDGSAGIWLLDPTTITIVNRGAGGANNDLNAADSILTTDYIETQSVGANITLTADDFIMLDMTGDTLTLANNRDLVLNANGRFVNNNSAGTIVASGTGSIVFNAATDIGLNVGVNLYSEAGNITLNAGQSLSLIAVNIASSQGGNISVNGVNGALGAYIRDTSLQTYLGGNILVNGRSNGMTGSPTGIEIVSSTITANGTGSVALTSSHNLLMGNDVHVNTQGGAMTFRADDNITMSNFGRFISQGGSITVGSDADGDGQGTINGGTHGQYTSNGGNIIFGGGLDPMTGYASGNTSNSSAVHLHNAIINASGTTQGGNIIVNGKGSAVVGCDNCNGFNFDGAQLTTNGTGGITINAIGGGTSSGGSGHGIALGSGLIRTENGHILLNGSTAGGGNSYAFSLRGTRIETTGNGDIYLTAAHLNPYAIHSLEAYNSDTVIHSAGGDVVLTLDAVSSSATLLDIAAGNDIIFQTANKNRTIGVGSASGDLRLSGTGMRLDAGGRLQIGSADQSGAITVGDVNWGANHVHVWAGMGDITLSGNQVVGADHNISLVSGAQITLANASSIVTSGTGSILLQAGWDMRVARLLTLTTETGDITLRANNNIHFEDSYMSGSYPVYNDTGLLTTQGGDIIFQSDYDGNLSGGMQFYRVNMQSNGGDIVLGGGPDPRTGYAYNNVDNRNYGIVVSLSNIKADGGDIIINGTGGLSNSRGVGISSSTLSSTGNGSILLRGQSGGDQNTYAVTGIETYTSQFTTQNGDIRFTGRTLSQRANSTGVMIGNGNLTTSGTGNIILEGFTGNGAVAVSHSAGNLSSGNSIRLTGNKITGVNGSITAVNDIVIQSVTAGLGISIGANIANTLNLTDAFMNKMTASNIWIGGYGNPGDAGYTNNAGTITVNSNSTVKSNLYLQSASGITLAGGTLNMAAGKNLDLRHNVTLTGNTTIAGSGQMRFGGTLDSTGNLTASAGNIVFNGNWGSAGQRLGNIALSSVNSLVLPSQVYAQNFSATVTGAANRLTTGLISAATTGAGQGNVTLVADRMTIGNNVSGHGNLTINSSNLAGIELNMEAWRDNERLSLDATELGRIQQGFGNIIIGDGTQHQGIRVGETTWRDNVSFNAGHFVQFLGEVKALGNAGITISGYATVDLRSKISTEAGNITFTVDRGGQVGNIYNGGNIYAYTGGGIETQGGNIVLSYVRMLENNASLSVNSHGGNISARSLEQNGSPTGTRVLTLDAGAGNVTIAGVVTGTYDLVMKGNTISLGGNIGVLNTRLGQVTLVSANDLVLPGNVFAQNADITVSRDGGKLTTQNVNVAGNLTLTADDLDILNNLVGTGRLMIRTANAGKNINLNSTHDINAMTLTTAELGRIANGWNQVDYISHNNINIGNLTVNDTTRFDAGGLVYVHGNLHGAGDSSLVFKAGNYMHTESVTVSTEGGYILMAAPNYYITGSTISTQGGAVTINGNLVMEPGSRTGIINSGGGSVLLGPVIGANAAGAHLIVNAGAGNAAFNGAVDTNANITVSAQSITLSQAWGGMTALGDVSLSSANGLVLPSITARSILARTTGAASDITLAGGSKLTASGSGDALVLASGRHFINLSDADVLNTPNGRWLVYSKNLAHNVRGGLMPNAAALYGTTYTGNAPSTIGAGNRFLFSDAASLAPSLVFTALNQTATYGDVLGTLGYSVSGSLASGDSYAEAYNGAPVVTTDKINAGFYEDGITISGGTLTSFLGYQFTFENGDLTIDKANLTITADSHSKAYGAVLNFTGNEFTHSGLKYSDTVDLVQLSSPGAAAGAAGDTVYAITADNASGTGLSNYNIQYVDGTLTVGAAPPPPAPPPAKLPEKLPSTVEYTIANSQIQPLSNNQIRTTNAVEQSASDGPVPANQGGGLPTGQTTSTVLQAMHGYVEIDPALYEEYKL